ncbi:MAG: murein transglycosylase A [Rhodothalassiaceae bacterium]
MAVTRRGAAWILGLLALVLVTILARAVWHARMATGERVAYVRVAFSDLPGWQEDDPRPALAAFRKSCKRLLRLAGETPLEPPDIAGRAADWHRACRAARTADGKDAATVRAFFECQFVPFSLRDGGRAEGLFTGYYEPLIEAARAPSDIYRIAVYRRPPELVRVDLGAFAPDLADRRIAGQVIDGALRPFATRADIEAGALAGRGLELLWARDPVAVFFLQIQGSGRARLPDGETLRLAYDGSNGHPYSAIGRLLVARGVFAPGAASAPAIAAWLRAHPEEGARLMAENASYVFFRIAEGPGPVGAEGVPLTPGRSLAVDPRHLPFGAPVWLASTVPDARDPVAGRLPLRRLMVAQDAGSAIRGAVRGDVFWGHGGTAATIAGHMAERGRLWLLLPRPITRRMRELRDHAS